MILLDSDHITVLYSLPGSCRERLIAQMAMSVDSVVGTTIVNFEE